jgi:hypothetical protein
MKSTRSYCAAIAALALGLAYQTSATNYHWTGAGDDTSWGQAANWDLGVPSQDTNVTFQVFIGTGFPTISPLPITIGVTDVIQTADQLFGPEWGQTLNFYGTMTNGFGFAPVGAVGGPQTHMNMYGNATITSLNSVFIGDMFWFPGGPNIVLNMFDNSKLATPYLALGGHINMYTSNTVTCSTFPLWGPPTAGFWGGLSTDGTRRFNIVNGTFILPSVLTPTLTGTLAVSNWVARNIFMAYGKAGSTNDLIVTDDGTNTYVRTAPLGGALQNVFIPPLNPANIVVGTVQQAKLLGNYPNVTNVLVSTAEPGVVPSSLPGSVVFSSSNPNIFTVSSDGIITGISPGTASLKAVLGTFTNTESVTVVPNTVTLLHEYKFNETSGTSASDSVGGVNWNGTLNGDAAFSGTGSVMLSGNSGSYVSLPSNIVANLDAITVEAWATFPGTIPPFANLFAFGNTDTTAFDPNQGLGENYITMSPHSTTNSPGNFQANFGIGLPGSGNEHDAVVTGVVLDNMANVHIVAVFNPLAGNIILYTNGVQAAINSNLGYFLTMENTVPSPLAGTLGADPLNYIGQSLYVADPFLQANVDEVRIYSGAMGAAQVAADHALGPNQLIGVGTSVKLSASKSGSSIILKWPTSSALVTVLSATSLSGPWTTFNSSGLTTDGSGNYQLTVPANNTVRFFRLLE